MVGVTEARLSASVVWGVGTANLLEDNLIFRLFIGSR